MGQAADGAGTATASGRADVLFTIEEVRERVDFDVVLPTYLPGGISFNRAAHDVSLPDDRPSFIGPLTLVYASADGQQGFFLYESAQTTLLLGDKGTRPFTIQGVEGEISEVHRNDGRRMVGLSWNVGGVSLILSAFVDDILTKDEIIKIANSVR